MKENKENLSAADLYQKHGERKLFFLKKEIIKEGFLEHHKGRKEMERASI